MPFYAVAGQAGERGATSAHDEEVLATARAHGASPAQVSIAWTLHQGPHVLAIPGTGNPDHLAENVAAGALRLGDDELELLNALPRQVGRATDAYGITPGAGDLGLSAIPRTTRPAATFCSKP